ncbi:MAG: class I SAM-dependent methyltransferase [Gemmatimonadaceae bacterium]
MPDSGSRGAWIARYAGHIHHTEGAPSRWVMQQCESLAPQATVCDIAGGRGRHAVPLAARAARVILVDFVEEAVRHATSRSGRISGVVADVAALPLRRRSCDLVVVVNFLDRDLFPTLIGLLKPGGHLVYETYTTEHVALVAAGLVRSPRSARFLLRPGELRSLVAPLVIVAYREGDMEDAAGRRACASVVARSEALALTP